eukprot:m.176591 g.176591  ORF g.176591 m.176591 type:complete len:253 (-) comp24453_c0_seq1:357-1115(-)
MSTKLLLFTSHRSNFAARTRYVVYHKGLEDVVEMVQPPANQGAVGGGACSLPGAVAADDSYMRTVREKNPLGKIPLLVLEDGCNALPESQIIVEYLEEKFSDRGPSLMPEDVTQRARARLVARIHDVYMGSHFLPVLFRDLSEEQTSIGLRWIETALDMLECEHPGGECFFVGGSVTIADIALAPTMVYMLEGNGDVGARLGGGEGPFHGRPNLKAWWACMMRDKTWLRVYDEMATMFPQNNADAHMFSGQV